jgi:hypothetical protein
MPYIKKEAREKFEDQKMLCHGALMGIGATCENAGELNYVITVIAQSYIKAKGLNYQHINDVIGALEGAKIELYRRVASSYEDEKIKENGDVNVIDD